MTGQRLKRKKLLEAIIISKFLLLFFINWNCSFSAELIRSVITKVESGMKWNEFEKIHPIQLFIEAHRRMSINVDVRSDQLDIPRSEGSGKKSQIIFFRDPPSCWRLLVLASCGVIQEKYYFLLRWNFVTYFERCPLGGRKNRYDISKMKITNCKTVY